MIRLPMKDPAFQKIGEDILKILRTNLGKRATSIAVHPHSCGDVVKFSGTALKTFGAGFKRDQFIKDVADDGMKWPGSMKFWGEYSTKGNSIEHIASYRISPLLYGLKSLYKNAKCDLLGFERRMIEVPPYKK